jgi:hypothetical protein
LYAVGPSPAMPGRVVGSAGPTTTARMARFIRKGTIFTSVHAWNGEGADRRPGRCPLERTPDPITKALTRSAPERTSVVAFERQ